jgi:hypothetical protein
MAEKIKKMSHWLFSPLVVLSCDRWSAQRTSDQAAVTPASVLIVVVMREEVRGMRVREAHVVTIRPCPPQISASIT